nr:N-acetylmuramoyl-L-alanine amidase [Paraconexibacter algicola]
MVEHVEVVATDAAVRNAFVPNRPDPEIEKRPGVCSHFVIDGAGRIHQLVPRRLVCRHTVGLDHTAIGIEHTGFTDGDVRGGSLQVERRRLRASASV